MPCAFDTRKKQIPHSCTTFFRQKLTAMAPKKSNRNPPKPIEQPKSEHSEQPSEATSKPKPAAKRKKQPITDTPQKAARRSARSAPKREPGPLQLLNYLLSPECRDLCRPKNEQDVPSSVRTYTTTVPLTPFEELLSAVILSRPISHALGQRTIRTLLNDPYNFRTPKAIRDAGLERVHQAVWDAKTQHKQKTAEQILTLADTVAEKFADKLDDASLEKLRREGEGDKAVLSETITNSFKGVGRTGVDIFMRRIQGHWVECFPYIDDRTSMSMEKLGLPTYEEPMLEVLDKNWESLKLDGVQGADEAEKRRMVFVKILERAISSDLEGKTDEVLGNAERF